MLTTAQIGALEGVAGRALTPAELADLAPLVEIRNDVAIAERLSVGRTALVPRTITSRGVRAALPIKDAVQFLSLLRETAKAPAAPAWLTDTLNRAGVAEADHFAYFDTMACAHGWLEQVAGIDLGVETTRRMLDLIALSDPGKYGAAVSALKKLAEVPDSINFGDISVALNNA